MTDFRLYESDVHWMALGSRTETDREFEALLVANVIASRMLRRGEPAWKIVTAPFQFSGFNAMPEEARQDEAAAMEWCRGHMAGMIEKAKPWVLIADRILFTLEPWQRPLPPTVRNFWSPQSMDPPFSRPNWNWSILRCFDVTGVDPVRFRFAETVPAGHPLAGWRRALPGEPESTAWSPG